MNLIVVGPMLLSLAQAVQTSPEARVSVRRFALIAAANNGGSDRVALRYAESDARMVLKVLNGLGGVDLSDQTLLVQPDAQDLNEAFRNMGSRIRSAQDTAGRTELIFYYSGHSDVEGLLLDGEPFPYRDLKRMLGELRADVRIAILDSCSSGAMTRTKGGRRSPPLMVDASNKVRGYAVLTSSSEDEAAQESDRIGGSFFTHYLVSGLRGAGDLSSDRRVTLNEAYHFAFHETLARTEKTLGGPQHAAYDIQLVGTGDIVMTDLRTPTANLVLDEASFGRLFVRDAESGRLSVELHKKPGRTIELGLEPGTYRVRLQQDGAFYEGTMAIPEGERLALDVSKLDHVHGEATTLRGTSEHPVERQVVPFDIGIIPPLSINGLSEPTLNNFSLSLAMSYGYDLEGVSISAGLSWLENDMEGVQISTGFNHVGGSARGAQLSTGFNHAHRGMGGFQAAAGFNLATGRGAGAQIAAGFNLVDGMLEGLQVSTGLNLATQGFKGAQMSAGVNYAKHGEGLQLGIVNIAEGVRGLQVGLVNLVQETEGPSVGLINYATKDGILDFKLFSADVALGGIAAEIGTKHFYTSVTFGAGTWEESRALSIGGVLGARMYLGDRWSVSVELGSAAFDQDGNFLDTDLLNSARLMASYRLLDSISVFLGPTLNILVDLDDVSEEDLRSAPRYAARPGDSRVYLWPGLMGGIQFF